MLLIDYKPIDFPDKNLAQPNTLRCTWADIVWAATMVGHQQVQQLTIQPQAYAYLELLHRINSVYVHLQTADYRPGLWGAMDTHIIQSSLYHRLGAAEKSIVSTFVGLIIARLFAAQLLRVPWLFKVDVYSQVSGIIGLDKEFQWMTMRVKGRSNRLEQRLVRKAKKLVQPVAIGKMLPEQHIGFFSYFTAVSKTLKAYLVNLPITAHNSSPNLDIGPDTFLRTYYTLILDFLSTDYGGKAETTTVADRAYRVKKVPEVDVRIGLDEQIYTLMRPEAQKLATDFLRHRADTTPLKDRDPRTTIEHDGIYIQLGDAWRDERMYLSPPERIS